MLLNEIEVANRLGDSFTCLSDIAKKRRVRALIIKAGIEPYIPERSIWLIPESQLHLIEERACPLKPPPIKPTSSGTSKEISSSIKAFRIRKNAQKLRKVLNEESK